MGQAQSEVVPDDQIQSQHSPPSPSSFAAHNSQSSASLETLIAEATAYGNHENESLDLKAEKALECPCIADLRNGPCGVQFSDAFLCFLKSTTEEKGSDCVHPFVALQNCIKATPNAFSKNILEEEVDKNEELAPRLTIIPPIWSRESSSPKPKL